MTVAGAKRYGTASAQDRAKAVIDISARQPVTRF